MSSTDLRSFWRALDETPEATTDRREWMQRLGSSWKFLAKYLRPTGQLAQEIGCSSPGGDGCPRKIIQHGANFRAVCGNRPEECDAIELSRDEISCYELNQKALAGLVAHILQTEAGSDLLHSLPAQFAFVGMHLVSAGLGIPVVLFVPGPWTSGPILEVVAEVGSSAAIVVPTPKSLPPGVRAKLQGAGCAVLTLTEMVRFDDDHGCPVGCRPSEELLSVQRKRLLESYAPAEASTVWLLPPQTQWEDLSFEFTASEMLNVRFGNETKRFEPEHFGMKNRRNGRPTAAWTILQSFAIMGGRLTWNDPKAHTRIKKQKQVLSDALKTAFGIGEDPIVWRKPPGAYETRFVIRDSNPAAARLKGRR